MSAFFRKLFASLLQAHGIKPKTAQLTHERGTRSIGQPSSKAFIEQAHALMHGKEAR